MYAAFPSGIFMPIWHVSHILLPSVCVGIPLFGICRLNPAIRPTVHSITIALLIQNIENKGCEYIFIMSNNTYQPVVRSLI